MLGRERPFEHVYPRERGLSGSPRTWSGWVPSVSTSTPHAATQIRQKLWTTVVFTIVASPSRRSCAKTAQSAPLQQRVDAATSRIRFLHPWDRLQIVDKIIAVR